MKIAEVYIPQMFTAYAEDRDYLENGLHHFQYFCEECKQAFASAWGRVPGTSIYEKGRYFTCPSCGKVHGNNVAYIDSQELVPNKARICLKAYKKFINLEVYCETTYFRDLFDVRSRKYKEVFRFDIEKQQVSFNNGEESFEIGNPFDLRIFEKSILRFFRANSLAHLNHKDELSDLLKMLRETTRSALEKKLGYKIRSAYIHSGQCHGMFLAPILNIAFRINFPDASNLTSVYQQRLDHIERFWETKLIHEELIQQMSDLMKQKGNFSKALIEYTGLPNKAAVRKILGKDFFEIGYLVKAFELCKNYDLAIRLETKLSNMVYDFYSGSQKELISFLLEMQPIYGDSGIVQIVEKINEFRIWDCIRTYQHLSVDNKQALANEKIRLKDLHDWLDLHHKKQNFTNVQFEVPEHIMKRLSMQKDRLKFFLPDESMALLKAGMTLHNCVASYSSSMQHHKSWIVLVADDKGKLTACLEVKGKVLIQAKLDRNQPVSKNPELNAEVLAWAKEADIKINTSDVEIPATELLAEGA